MQTAFNVSEVATIAIAHSKPIFILNSAKLGNLAVNWNYVEFLH